MDSAQNQLVDRIHTATNILVTVSRDPSVDQLAACLGLTLMLNKLSKHATAVFSGHIPSTIEFLQPEDTLEKNTDSLRDFIIALDKTKADKLRYKVEDDLVRIFITPYKTSISQADLEFSQGEFNVDMVIALGVNRQEDLDEAITAHGRILHDATVTSINTGAPGEGLGSINWSDPAASSLCELVAGLVKSLGTDLYDGQIATALLTGIVAETARFSNEKTTPSTMSISSELMGAGANQQLIASKLEEPLAVAASDDHTSPAAATDVADEPDSPAETEDGTLEIEHDDEEPADETPEAQPEPEVPDEVAPEATEPIMPEVPEALPAQPEPEAEAPSEPPAGLPIVNTRITEPPAMGGTLTANTVPESYDPPTDPLSLPSIEQHLLNHDVPAEADQLPPEPFINSPAIVPDRPMLESVMPPADPVAPVELPAPAPAPVQTPAATQPPILVGFTPPPPAWVPPSADALTFGSPADSTDAPIGLADPQATSELPVLATNDTAGAQPPSESSARDEVLKALEDSEATPAPIEALNAQPMMDNINAVQPPDVATPAVPAPLTPLPAPNDPMQPTVEPDFSESLPQATMPVPPSPTLVLPPIESAPVLQPAESSTTPDADAPPPVPPPIPFHFGNTTEPPK
jgi:hypothetical protein